MNLSEINPFLLAVSAMNLVAAVWSFSHDAPRMGAVLLLGATSAAVQSTFNS